MTTKASNGAKRGKLGVGVLAIAAAAGLTTSAHAQGGEGTTTNFDPYANLPASLSLTGVVRDFRDRSAAGGHPDFQRQPSGGFGHYVGMVADELNEQGNPVFASTGRRVSSNWRDSMGRNIMPPRAHFPSIQGDTQGSLGSQSGALTSAENFDQWFRDVPGVNASQQLPLTLVREAGTNRYVFNDRTDSAFSSLGGFFPINGQMYGNYGSTGKNFHFTFELDTEFVYQAGSGQVFTFTGDDDVWVFIDGKCVIDIGGVHSAVSQTIDLDRLSWLEDGQMYSLKFFFAERHTTQSNFRIETTIGLRTVRPPTTTALHD
ncbi:MAG: fibro-slime domain-containing protein [Phycisphaeraceae bacterium]|nr:fibro-slime domain-containing protein [Phycisphaeraceae bacterium]